MSLDFFALEQKSKKLKSMGIMMLFHNNSQHSFWSYEYIRKVFLSSFHVSFVCKHTVVKINVCPTKRYQIKFLGPLFDFCPSVICQKFNSKVWSKMWHFLSSNGCTVALCWSLCNFRLFFSPHCKPEEMSRLVPHKNRIGIFNTKENFLF